MFSIGDPVCYPMHGAGYVAEIVEQTVLGKTGKYFRLQFSSDRMTVLVPVEGAENAGLRPLSDLGICEEAILLLSSPEVPAENENWNQRYRENLEKLKTGNLLTVAAVVKCLSAREKARGLSSVERKMLLSARDALVSELVAATGRGEEELRTLAGA